MRRKRIRGAYWRTLGRLFTFNVNVNVNLYSASSQKAPLMQYRTVHFSRYAGFAGIRDSVASCLSVVSFKQYSTSSTVFYYYLFGFRFTTAYN